MLLSEKSFTESTGGSFDTPYMCPTFFNISDKVYSKVYSKIEKRRSK